MANPKYNPAQPLQAMISRLFRQIAANRLTVSKHVTHKLKCLTVLASIWMVSACDGSNCAINKFSFDDCTNEDSKGEWQKIEFVRVDSTGRFDDGNWGHHFFYFPLFARTDEFVDGKDTDNESSVEVNRKFEKLVHFDDVSKRDATKLDNRTFSFDDALDKDEPGAKTASGEGWPTFYLPEDDQGHSLSGRSGVVYDPKTRDSSNNIVNQIVSNDKNLHAFCLNIVTDNTGGKYDPDVEIEARTDYDSAAARVPTTTLAEYFKDDEPDVYTFKYTGFQKGDKIKIRIKASSAMENGGGLGGIMVSDIHNCCTESCSIENECGGDNGCGQACGCTKGETQVSDLVPSVIDDFNDIENEQGFYIRGLYTRQVLTVDDDNTSLVMRPRRNTENQQWVFVGACDIYSRYNTSACEGYFVNKLDNKCLAFDESGVTAQVGSGTCTDDRFKWILTAEGEDEVTGKVGFSGVPKYSIRAKQSNNNYLVARATKTEVELAEAKLIQCDEGLIQKEKLEAVKKEKYVGVENRSNPDRPWDHWVFEYQIPGEMVVTEDVVAPTIECRPELAHLVK